MAVAVYERASTHVRPWHYIETSAGDLPTSGPFYLGDYYRDLEGRYFEWNGDHFVPIALATLGPVTIGTVDQGSPGVGSWPVVEDNSADILAGLGAPADAEQDDPTQTASVVALLKGILAKPSAGGSTAPTTALAWQQSCTSGSATVAVSGPIRVTNVVVNYDAPVTATVTITRTSALGSAFNANLDVDPLVSQSNLSWVPDDDGGVITGDTFVVFAPGVTGQVVSIVVQGRMGL